MNPAFIEMWQGALKDNDKHTWHDLSLMLHGAVQAGIYSNDPHEDDYRTLRRMADQMRIDLANSWRIAA